MRSWTHTAIGLAIAALSAGCTCTDPADVDVSPECDSKPASATMNLHGELADIRPVGADKQIRVSGNRGIGESLCFADGGVQSFSVVLQGQSTVDVPTPPLAHGVWELTVTPLSGGDHPMLPAIKRILQPGVAYTTAVTAGPGGTLQVALTP